ncbi:heme-binding domain-containing protein [Mucilaginibacter sp.]|uniref:heme-binding domain-containing protein n=1 Tax=Mucilaginibacter sp. TaxID=1882438 RepID=UPI0026122EE0|nr:heme-binding domain-containing protein [Mucilaginibacter sp.]MDB4922529.1 cytochrome [Mucilaginibacter sp.]
MKKIKRPPLLFKILIVAIVLFAAAQFIRPKLNNPPVTGDFKAPNDVKNIVVRACYDCHSNETYLRWYDKISPGFWQVAEHVKDGRSHLNFSKWDSLAPADQKEKLWEVVNQVAGGAMPVKSYEFVHPSTKISPNDLAVLKKYVAGMAQSHPGDTAKINAADKQYKQWQNVKPAVNLPQAANGITYNPDYKNWQPISTTERFDNGTMRVIFGNDVAVKAIKENNIRPWPNGTIFAKVAWDQLEDMDGNITTGAFKQVEYMIKDDKKYASTKGWGWARFKTPKMVPYGKNAMFATECVDCHKPLKDEDFVFTRPIKN